MGLLCGKVTCSSSSLGDKGHHELFRKGVWTDHQSEVVAVQTCLPTDNRKMTHRYQIGACASFCRHSHRLPARVDALGAHAAGAAPGKPIHPRALRHPRASKQGLSSPGPFLDQLRWLEKAKQASRHTSLASACFSQALQWL